MQDETSQFAVIQYSLPLGSSQFLAECLESTSLLVQQWSACTGYHVAGYISHARNISSATYERRARFCRSGILVSAGRFFCKKELDSTPSAYRSTNLLSLWLAGTGSSESVESPTSSPS